MITSETELLEQEDAEQRFARLQQLLASQDSPSTSRQVQPALDGLLAHTGPLEGPNDLIARVQAFLPQLRAANEELEQQPPSRVNMEEFEGTEEAYIELNLGLGLFEQHGVSSATHERSSASSSDTESSSDSSSTTSSSSDDDESEEEGVDLIALVTGTRPLQPLPRPRRRGLHPGIVVLDTVDPEPSSSSPSGS